MSRAFAFTKQVPIETALDHYFIYWQPPIPPAQFEGVELTPELICSLGWWIRGAKIQTERVRNHFAIQTTYPNLGQPNVEVSIRSEDGARYLDIESAYFYALKNQGLGSCAFLRCVKAAQQIGCQYIVVQASGKKSRDPDGDNGHYSWPRMGFNADVTSEILAALSGRIDDLSGIRDVREIVLLYGDIWKAMNITLPLRFSLDENVSDLAHLYSYLRGKRLLL